MKQKIIVFIVRSLLLISTILITFGKISDQSESGIIETKLTTIKCQGPSSCGYEICSELMNGNNTNLTYIPDERCDTSNFSQTTCQTNKISRDSICALSIFIGIIIIYLTIERITDNYTKRFFEKYDFLINIIWQILISLFFVIFTCVIIGLSYNTELLNWDCSIIGYSSVIFVYLHVLIGFYDYFSKKDDPHVKIYIGFLFFVINILLICLIAGLISSPSIKHFNTYDKPFMEMLATTHNGSYLYQQCYNLTDCNRCRCELSANINVDRIKIISFWYRTSCKPECRRPKYSEAAYVSLISVVLLIFCLTTRCIQEKNLAKYIAAIALTMYTITNFFISISMFLFTVSGKINCESNVVAVLLLLLVILTMLSIDYYLTCVNDINDKD